MDPMGLKSNNPHSSHPHQDSPAERHGVLGFQVLHLAAHWQCEKSWGGISVLWGWGLSGGGIIYVYIRYVICIYIYNLVLLFDIWQCWSLNSFFLLVKPTQPPKFLFPFSLSRTSTLLSKETVRLEEPGSKMTRAGAGVWLHQWTHGSGWSTNILGRVAFLAVLKLDPTPNGWRRRVLSI